jgi:hypothetical protein
MSGLEKVVIINSAKMSVIIMDSVLKKDFVIAKLDGVENIVRIKSV